MIYALGNDQPDRDPTSWTAPTAVLIGKVRLKERASVWWNAVLRGDNEWIEIGENSNVQDNAVLHTDPGSPLTIGKDVTVGHLAMLHGCTIADGALIGMGATVLNDAIIGEGAIVGANALIANGKEIPPYSLVIGQPGKIVKTLTPEQSAKFKAGAARYVENAQRFNKDLKKLED
jgi:carbonic anhydrase/acetyltransferase-like protein (isoleucine patch superfamily)